MMYLIASIIFLIIFYWIRPWLVSSNLEKSTLFADYINLLIPFTLSVLLYIQLDIFVKVLYDAVYGIFATEFVQRVLNLLVTVLRSEERRVGKECRCRWGRWDERT